MIQLLRRTRQKETLASTTEDIKHIPIRKESSVIVVLSGLALALAVSALCNLVLIANNRSLAVKKSVYVQQPDGYTGIAQEFDQTHREAEVIKKTATTWMQMSFEWDSQIPGADYTDKGIKVGKQTVPTKTYLASFLMEPGFREEFLTLLGRDVLPQTVFSGNHQSVVRFYSVSEPRQVASAKWEVDIVATRVDRSANGEIGEIPLNRTIALKAVPPIEPSLGEEEPLAWRRKVYSLSTNGLMITEVTPLTLKP